MARIVPIKLAVNRQLSFESPVAGSVHSRFIDNAENCFTFTGLVAWGLGVNKRQLKILGVLQWIFYPISALMLLAFLADFFGGYRYWTDQVWGFFEAAEDPIAIVVILIFYLVFVALFWQFLRIEISRQRQRRAIGKPLIELYPARIATRFVLPLVALLFVVGLNLVIFVPGATEVDIESLGLDAWLYLFFFYLVAHFLLIAFALRAVRQLPFFVATEEGFIYEPGDLSPGLVRWSDVSEGAEAMLLTSGGTNIGGPRTALTIVLSLKDPDSVFAAYNPLLKGLNNAATRIIKYQTGGVGDIVLAAVDFGDRFDEVVALIRKKLGSRWKTHLPD